MHKLRVSIIGGTSGYKVNITTFRPNGHGGSEQDAKISRELNESEPGLLNDKIRQLASEIAVLCGMPPSIEDTFADTIKEAPFTCSFWLTSHIERG